MDALPHYLEPGEDQPFPDPRPFDDDGLVAVGGDLEPARLIRAYGEGIFPWFSEGQPPLWWSPSPRGVLEPKNLHVSRRLERTIRQGGFELSWNRSFRAVQLACDEGRPDGSWILPEMVEAYGRLHELGHAHSLEVHLDGVLVAGTYGVQIGALFCAESKFHRVRDLSKVALVTLARWLGDAGIELIDVQFQTEHLAQFGVVEWRREHYLERIAGLVGRSVDLRRLPVGGV